MGVKCIQQNNSSKYIKNENALRSEIRLYNKNLIIFSIQESQLYNILISKIKNVIQKKYDKTFSEYRIVFQNNNICFNQEIGFQYDFITTKNNTLNQIFNNQKILLLLNENSSTKNSDIQKFEIILNNQKIFKNNYYVLQSKLENFLDNFNIFKENESNRFLFNKFRFPFIYFSSIDKINMKINKENEISNNLIYYQKICDFIKNCQITQSFYKKNLKIDKIFSPKTKEIERDCYILDLTFIDYTKNNEIDKFHNLFIKSKLNFLFLYEEKHLFSMVNFLCNFLIKKLCFSSEETMDYIFKLNPLIMNSVAENTFFQSLVTNMNNDDKEENEIIKYIKKN